MKRNTKHTKAPARKSARAKTPSSKSRGQNAAKEPVAEKLTPGQEQKKRLLALPLAGQGRTVTSPTPLDE